MRQLAIINIKREGEPVMTYIYILKSNVIKKCDIYIKQKYI